MPQLDFITYFNQYISFIVISSFCLLLMLKSLLPRIRAAIISREISTKHTNHQISSNKFEKFKKLFFV